MQNVSKLYHVEEERKKRLKIIEPEMILDGYLHICTFSAKNKIVWIISLPLQNAKKKIKNGSILLTRLELVRLLVNYTEVMQGVSYYQ